MLGCDITDTIDNEHIPARFSQGCVLDMKPELPKRNFISYLGWKSRLIPRPCKTPFSWLCTSMPPLYNMSDDQKKRIAIIGAGAAGMV